METLSGAALQDFLKVEHFFSGREYAKRMTLPKGHWAESHVHSYDHLSILAYGRATVETPEGVTEYGPGSCLTIKAGVTHKIVALEDSVWFCVHSTTETDPAKVDEVLIRS